MEKNMTWVGVVIFGIAGFFWQNRIERLEEKIEDLKNQIAEMKAIRSLNKIKNAT